MSQMQLSNIPIDSAFVITSFALLIIIVVFIKSIKGIKSGTSLSRDATSVLTTIGIFFTFFGISIALFYFDPANINKSIPLLLGGLKVAFVSSVAGLGASLLYKYLKPRYEIETDQGKSEVSAEDLYAVLQSIDKTIDTGNKNIKDALTGDGDASLSTQFGKLRNDFRDFAEKVAEDGSQKLIEALEQVIKDFNQKITEQFGENFKQLNEAVGALLVWQQEHKDHVEKLTAAYEKTTESIQDINTSFKDIENSTAKIPASMENIEKVFDSTNVRMQEMHEGLKSLADMRQKAEESLPFIHDQITNMTDNLQQSVNKQTESIQQNIELMAKNDEELKTFVKQMNEEIQNSHAAIHSQIEESVSQFSTQTQDLFTNNYKEQEQYMHKQKEQFEGLVTSLTMSADNILEQSQKSSKIIEGTIQDTSSEFKNLTTQFGEAQNQFNNDVKTNLNDSVNDTQEALNTAIQEVNNKMNEQLNNTLQVLGDNLVSITNGLAKSYQDSTEEINKAIKDIRD